MYSPSCWAFTWKFVGTADQNFYGASSPFLPRGITFAWSPHLFIPPRDRLSRKMWRLLLAGTARPHEISCTLTANQKILQKDLAAIKCIGFSTSERNHLNLMQVLIEQEQENMKKGDWIHWQWICIALQAWICSSSKLCPVFSTEWVLIAHNSP